jgi:hypothetical protein
MRLLLLRVGHAFSQTGDVAQGLLGGPRQLVTYFRGERPGHLSETPERTPCDGSDQIQVFEQFRAGRCRGWRLARHLPARLQKQQWFCDDALAQLTRSVPPGCPELADLLRAQLVAGDPGRERLAGCTIGARHRKQVLHRGVGADLTLAHPLLDCWRQIFHQAQPA